MSRSKPLIFMVAALVLAALAGIGAHRFIQSKAQAAAARRITTNPVVVAARDLAAGITLQATDLSIRQWPLAGLPRGRFHRLEPLVGRVLDGPVLKGEALLKAKLAPLGVSGSLSALVKPGLRAVSVGVDPVIGVAGFVKPGDRVDVLATVEVGKFSENPTSRIVLQDVEVLTVGENLEKPQGDKKKKPKASKVKVVTLQMTPSQSQRLALAAAKSKLLLTLRNLKDHAEPKASYIHLTNVFPVPPKVVQPVKKATNPIRRKVDEIEVIKGVQRVSGPGAPKPKLAPGRKS